MKLQPILIGISILSIFTLTSPLSGQEKTEPVPVDSVDLGRYTGLWYEIAKIPNTFQRKCTGKTTAEYTLREDGRIQVVNTCSGKQGERIQAKGIAKVVDVQSNAKLKVSFVRFLGINLFWGNYWIIGLDENYEYAIIGDPEYKYGWILSRKPEMTAEELDTVFAILHGQGYETERFEMTEQ
jgi:apolipoprotein D and lipocalin family protein